MKKELRQAKIEQLINQRPLANQEELMAALKELGISATQATISRDIREMQIVKQQDAQGNLRYMIFKAHNSSEQDKLNKAIYDSVTAVILVEFMNVIHTTPRSANVLAAILDDLALEDIAGTVAGFDTVVVISPTRESAVKINTLFNEHLAHDELT
ncbi:arginine repressor [Ligilactobacillus faecis]|uniref:arginine repressor n=1 Tax=Ligilactobacillus faecis TaxID=762833 RepID=UPI0024697181|nr:ArgR family transcriptional regulator [Ligilactobacillus faecis]WGN89339.1 ArgR family transcriptional regulator [Ligilactobacillus faecis]